MTEKIKEFEEDLLGGDLEKYGFNPVESSLIPSQVLGNIEVGYYGGEVSYITISEIDIEKLVDDIPSADGSDDELCYRLTEEALKFLMEKIVEEGGVVD